MKNINHPIGNIKIFIIKKTAEFIKATILNILSLLINIKKQSQSLIKKAITKALKNKPKKSTLYGNGDSSQKITRRLEKIKLNNELMEKKLMY